MGSPNFTTDWHSHNIPHLRQSLDRYKGQPGVQALEIGCFEGRSTLWFLENILTDETARIDCIDTFNGSPEHKRMGISVNKLLDRFLDNTQRYREKVCWIRGQSQDVMCSWGFRNDERKYDFIYIDGSHKAADVLEDAVLSFRLLKIGGLMIFDDYAWEGGGPSEFDNPKIGIDAFYRVYRNQLKREHTLYQAIFQRVPEYSVETKSKPLDPCEMVARLVS